MKPDIHLTAKSLAINKQDNNAATHHQNHFIVGFMILRELKQPAQKKKARYQQEG